MSVAFSPNNKLLASGGLDGYVNIFDVEVRQLSFYPSPLEFFFRMSEVFFLFFYSRIVSGVFFNRSCSHRKHRHSWFAFLSHSERFLEVKNAAE